MRTGKKKVLIGSTDKCGTGVNVQKHLVALQGKENIFVSMHSYKTKQLDEQGKAIYQDVCYPVTKEFREKLYAEIVREYEQAKEINQNQARKNAEDKAGNMEKEQEKEATPFR